MKFSPKRAGIRFGLLGLAAWIVFVVVLNVGTGERIPGPIFLAVAAFSFVVPGALAYLGVLVLAGNIGMRRLAIALSVAWVLGAMLIFDPIEYSTYSQSFVWDLDDYLLFGPGPVLAFWGILWVLAGFKGVDTSPPED